MHQLFILNGAGPRRALEAFLDAYAAKAGHKAPTLAVEVTDHEDGRSWQQLKRHWAIIGQIAEQAKPEGRSYTPETWHRFFCGLYLGYVELPGGKTEGMPSPKGKKAFAEFTDQIEAYAATELGLVILDPTEPEGRP